MSMQTAPASGWPGLAAGLHVLRPMALAATAGLTAVGFALGNGSDVHGLLLASVVTTSGVGASMVYNDIVDIGADRLNSPHRPLPAGLFSVRAAHVVMLALAAITLLVGLSLGLPTMMLWATASLALGLSYSRWLQRTLILGNVAVAGLFANALLFGSAAAGSVTTGSLLAAAEVFWFILGRESLKGIPDIEGDRATGSRTIATTWGPIPAVRIFCVCVGLCLATAAFGVVVANASAAHLIFVASAVTLPSARIARALVSVTSPERVVSLVDRTALIWLFGLFGLLLLRPF
jgi:4-hydroxybenzoate polyprenyltransferase